MPAECFRFHCFPHPNSPSEGPGINQGEDQALEDAPYMRVRRLCPPRTWVGAVTAHWLGAAYAGTVFPCRVSSPGHAWQMLRGRTLRPVPQTLFPAQLALLGTSCFRLCSRAVWRTTCWKVCRRRIQAPQKLLVRGC